MVGRAVAECALRLNYEAIGFAHAELDIASEAAVMDAVARVRPCAIINCAALTDVDGCESDEGRAYAVNCKAVGFLANAAKKFDAAFVTISTDYVFDGTKQGFYTQRDTPNPVSVYGHSKLAGERAAQNIYARTIIARTGWVYGVGGTNFLSRIYTDAPALVAEMRARGMKIKAIDDAYGSPTAAKDLAKRLIELAEKDLPGIYHTVGAGAGATYADFAKRALIRTGLADIAHELETVSQNALNRPAPRPTNSRMKCLLTEAIGLAPLPNWEENL